MSSKCIALKSLDDVHIFLGYAESIRKNTFPEVNHIFLGGPTERKRWSHLFVQLQCISVMEELGAYYYKDGCFTTVPKYCWKKCMKDMLGSLFSTVESILRMQ